MTINYVLHLELCDPTGDPYADWVDGSSVLANALQDKKFTPDLKDLFPEFGADPVAYPNWNPKLTPDEIIEKLQAEESALADPPVTIPTSLPDPGTPGYCESPVSSLTDAQLKQLQLGPVAYYYKDNQSYIGYACSALPPAKPNDAWTALESLIAFLQQGRSNQSMLLSINDA